MTSHDSLREQIRQDLQELRTLILRYAKGDRTAKIDRDRLDGAVTIKMILLRSSDSLIDNQE